MKKFVLGLVLLVAGTSAALAQFSPFVEAPGIDAPKVGDACRAGQIECNWKQNCQKLNGQCVSCPTGYQYNEGVGCWKCPQGMTLKPGGRTLTCEKA